jgi:hypothetical protein
MKQQLIETSAELKEVRRQIRRLKVIEDGLFNRMERLLIENQTGITFEDDEERDNGQSSVHPTGGSDGFSEAEII